MNEAAWGLLAAVAILALMLAKLYWENGENRKRIETLERQDSSIRTEPFPSDNTDEMQAIKEAKALCKKMGVPFDFDKAHKALRTVREARGDAAGGSNKKTA